MAQENNLSLRLSDSQLDKLKSAKRNAIWVTLRSSSNMIGNNETNFPNIVSK